MFNKIEKSKILFGILNDEVFKVKLLYNLGVEYIDDEWLIMFYNFFFILDLDNETLATVSAEFRAIFQTFKIQQFEPQKVK